MARLTRSATPVLVTASLDDDKVADTLWAEIEKQITLNQVKAHVEKGMQLAEKLREEHRLHRGTNDEMTTAVVEWLTTQSTTLLGFIVLAVIGGEPPQSSDSKMTCKALVVAVGTAEKPMTTRLRYGLRLARTIHALVQANIASHARRSRTWTRLFVYSGTSMESHLEPFDIPPPPAASVAVPHPTTAARNARASRASRVEEHPQRRAVPTGAARAVPPAKTRSVAAQLVASVANASTPPASGSARDGAGTPRARARAVAPSPEATARLLVSSSFGRILAQLSAPPIDGTRGTQIAHRRGVAVRGSQIAAVPGGGGGGADAAGAGGNAAAEEAAAAARAAEEAAAAPLGSGRGAEASGGVGAPARGGGDPSPSVAALPAGARAAAASSAARAADPAPLGSGRGAEASPLTTGLPAEAAAARAAEDAAVAKRAEDEAAAKAKADAVWPRVVPWVDCPATAVACAGCRGGGARSGGGGGGGARSGRGGGGEGEG